jgi:HYR domain
MMRGTIRWAVGLGTLTATLFGLVLAVAASAVTSVTIGEIFPGIIASCDPQIAVQAGTSGTSYAVPAGNWNITSWSTSADTGSMGLIVFRPTASPNTYTFVGASQVQTLGAPGLSTFTLAPNSTDPPIATQGGDLLGFRTTAPTQRCLKVSTGADADLIQLLGGEPPTGTQVTLPVTVRQSLLNISATLTPPTAADTTPPSLSLPADIVANATGPAGATVTYTATATDQVDGQVAVSCGPPSGSTFPIGASTVNCSASDKAGNTASASFAVHVEGASEQLADLRGTVTGIGPGASLAAKVNQALASLTTGTVAASCSVVQAFINQVSAQSGKSVAAGTASSLIADATRIRAVLGC